MKMKLFSLKASFLIRPLIVALLGILVLNAIAVPCLQAAAPSNTNQFDAYDFPIKPGTDQWKAFKNHQEMIDACQIPESALKSMSTAGLVETVLSYPLSADMHAYNNLQTGFEIVAKYFNGIPELLSRNDAATELINKYKTIDLSSINNSWSPLERGNFVMGTVDSIEMLLKQDVILNKMNESERNNLLKLAQANYQIKLGKKDFYSQQSIETDSSIIESITGLQWSARDTVTPGPCIEAYETNDECITPHNTQVPNYHWISGTCVDFPDPASIDATFTQQYPNAIKCGTSTRKYNCHSWAWWSQSTANNHWIEDPSYFINDGSYSYVGYYNTQGQPSGDPNWWPGEKMCYTLYSTLTHSAVAMWFNVPGYGVFHGCESKWGSGPLMQGLIGYNPYWVSGVTIYYYN